MSSEDITIVSSTHNGINSQLLFQDDPLRFGCAPPQQQQQQQRRVATAAGDPGPKTRELSAFIDDKLFSSSSNSSSAPDHRFFPPSNDFPRSIYRDDSRNWNANGNGSSDDDDDSEDEDDEEDDDDDVHGTDVSRRNQVNSSDRNGGNNGVATATATNNGANVDKTENANGKSKNHSSYGPSSELVLVRDGVSGGPGQATSNAVTVAETDADLYYSQYLQATEGASAGGKDVAVDNGCSFSGRKEFSSFTSEAGDSLRSILSDPIMGSLMDDAMILPCGHSFGGAGIQQIIRMKACYTCSRSISEDSIAPNLSLRAAVQAFRREEELLFHRSPKRRRERFDQDKGSLIDPNIIDATRGRGVQFPFAVTDRVIIKGNKRTPPRFVGREAVVTTQCLNGWYVVKTLDNAESVKLQYRSLAKVSEDSSSIAMPSKMAPNWL